MPIVRDTLGIVFVAGVLATGVHTLLPKGATTPARQDAPARPSTPAASLPRDVPAAAPAMPAASPAEDAQARERLRDAMSAARAPAQPIQQDPPPQAAPVAPVQDPPPAQPPREAIAAVDGRILPPEQRTEPGIVSGEAKPQLPPADIAWTPTPHPELVAKADASFDNGDIAGARMWLELAVEQGDADAAFRLAETYDPVVLAEWKVIGIVSNVGKARALYERAASGGVEPARQRVARIAN